MKHLKTVIKWESIEERLRKERGGEDLSLCSLDVADLRAD